MRMSTLRPSSLLVLLVCVVGLVAGPALAQSTFATLTGTVTDSSNAVLPGATVTVTNTRTQSVRTAVTDGTGNYLLPNLDAGEYRIVASLSAFSDQTRQIELLARQSVRVDVQRSEEHTSELQSQS